MNGNIFKEFASFHNTKIDFFRKVFADFAEYQYEMTKNGKVIRCRLFDESLVLVTGDLVL